MKFAYSFLIFLFSFPLVFAEELQKEIGNLVMEGIPDIPESLARRVQQYQNIRSASFSDWHPEGHGMILLTRFAETSQVHFVKTPEAYRRQLTFFDEPIQEALFSRRNPQQLIFTMDQDGGEFYQIYSFDLNSGKETLLTDGKSRNAQIVRAHQSDLLAFHSTKRNRKDFDIYTLSPSNPESIKLVKEVNGMWIPLDWSPDDRYLLLQENISINEDYLYIHDLQSGETTEINSSGRKKKIHYDSALFSPDGKGIYYVSDEDSQFLKLTYYDLKTGKKKILTDEFSWDVWSFDLSRDGKWLAYTVNENGIIRLYLTERNNVKKAQRIDIPAGVISGLKFNPQSTALAFTLSRPTAPADVYSLSLPDGKVKRWTFSEVGGLNPETFVEPELIYYPTFDQVNGKPRMIPAFYYKPSAKGEKFPVIIRIHGGPESQSRADFQTLHQFWVHELGAAVLVPNVRGSLGYGKTYVQLDNGFLREDSVKDIGKLLDWIATRPELDSSRVAVYGVSYGGYMVLASMFHFPDRLRCGVDIVGISNFVTFLERTEQYRRDLRRVEYGDERDPKMREFLNRISPAENAHRIKSPLFVIQGKNDPRVPLSESEQMVKVIRAHGGKVWYLMAKDEGHGFRKKTNTDFLLNATALFLEQCFSKAP